MLSRVLVAATAAVFVVGCATASPTMPSPAAPMLPQALTMGATPVQAPVSSQTRAAKPPLASSVSVNTVPAISAGASPIVASLSVQDAITQLVDIDSELDNTELLARAGSFSTQGFFKDIKEKIQQKREAHRLKKEAKKQLKDRDNLEAESKKGELAALKKGRSNETSTTNELPDGGKAVTTTWTRKKWGDDATMTMTQTYDADGTLVSTSITEKGSNKGGQTFETTRTRTLKDDDGTYEVYTKSVHTYKDGSTQIKEWTKTVHPDGSAEITGTITHKDGTVTTVSGSRGADGKTKVEPKKDA